ncbi:hypothetical protein CLOP_g12640 [Closterium sp. NIES-67]|nr:hypothetical protein CLOP_g12640 [Closterium sp. NIES-67]
MARRVDVTKRSSAARPAISLDDGVPPPEHNGVDLLPRPLPSSEQQDARNRWDTAGQERFRAISSTYYRGAHACILAFDLGDPNTFNKMKKWASEVTKHNQGQQVLFFLVGCKADMFHAVKHDQGLKVAQELNAEYFEVSAKSGDNVPWLFNRVAYVLLQHKIEACMQPAQPFSSAFKSKVAPMGGGKGIGSTSAGKGTENWKEKHHGKVLSLKRSDSKKLDRPKGLLFKC